MEPVSIVLLLIATVLKQTQEVRYNKKRCKYIASRCSTIKFIVDSIDGQDISKYSCIFESLIVNLHDAQRIVSAFERKNILKIMVNSYTKELDLIIERINAIIIDITLVTGMKINEYWRHFKSDYLDCIKEDNAELPILLRNNEKQIDDIRKIISILNVDYKIERIMDIVDDTQCNTDAKMNKIADLVKNIKSVSPSSREIYSEISKIVANHTGTEALDHLARIGEEIKEKKRGFYKEDIVIPEDNIVLGPLIGSGSFGDIYEGLFDNKKIAVKIVRKVPNSQTSIFEREVRAMHMLRDCCNVIGLIGYNRGVNDFMIVMELAENGDLFNYLHSSEQKLTDHQKIFFVKELCHGIMFMHNLGLIHRDLKSPNVLLDAYLRPKITDFGLTKIGLGTLISTLSKSTYDAVGSMYWKAPELFEGFNKHSTKSDMYSFGIIVWEIIHESLPYFGEQNDDIRRMVCQGMRESIDSDNEMIRTVIELCWLQDPVARPEAAEIFKMISEYQDATNSIQSNVREEETLIGTADSLSVHANQEKETHETKEIAHGDIQEEIVAYPFSYDISAQEENASSICNLGHRYYNGIEVAKDYNKAFELFKSAANKGNTAAMSNMASCYYHGNGTKQNIKKAIKYCKQAANLGNTKAAIKLANYYYDKDHKETLKWLEVAAGYTEGVGDPEIVSVLEEYKASDTVGKSSLRRFIGSVL